MTDAPNRVIIERIEPRTWALRVRDTKTDQVHELELRGGGPWKIDLNGKAVVNDGGEPRPQVAAPPDDAITLRLEGSGRPGVVRVAAVGRGAKTWADVQGTLLGARWVHDATGAPIVLLEERPSLVEEIQAALPEVSLDPSKYIAEASPPDTVGIPAAANTAPSATPASAKKSRRGFGGKVQVPPDTDIQLGLSNIGRADDMVSVVATARVEDVDAQEVAAWVKRRAASLGSWQAADTGQVALVRDRPRLPEELVAKFPGISLELGMYKRPGVNLPDREAPLLPESLEYPEVSGTTQREDPRVVKILSETIRQLSEVFIVIPRIRGHGFRGVELLTDRPTGVYDGLPIGTSLLQVALHHNAGPTIVAKDWEPLQKTLRALNRPAKQFDMLREYVSEVLNSASSAARDGVKEPVVEAKTTTAAKEPAATATSPGKPRGRKKARPEPGAGPGGLTWVPIEDRGAEGLAARWGEGNFKLLHIGGDKYGLFYEHDAGGYETMLCGTLDDGKNAAGERAAGARPTLDLTAAQVACASTRKTGRPTNDEITLQVRRSSENSAAIIIRATGDRVHEWAFANRTALGSEWVRREDNVPEVTTHDSSTLIADLRKEFPGVNIDTSAYKKLKTEPPPPKPTTSEPATPVEAPEASAPEVSPAGDQDGQDAELLRSFTSALETMLDEED